MQIQIFKIASERSAEFLVALRQCGLSPCGLQWLIKQLSCRVFFQATYRLSLFAA